MNRLLPGILLVSVSLTISACGGGGSTGDREPVPPIQGLLKQVSSPAELENSIKSGFSVMRSAEEIADLQAAAAPAGNFTGTYTQETRVDEFDAVRYDGSNLYVAPRRYFHCCFVAAESTGTSVAPERSIRVLATDPDNGTAALASTIPLDDDVSIQGMYVADDRMFALTGTSIYGHFGGMWADVAIWAPEKLGFSIYDMADPSNPQLDIEATIDGVFVESRRIGNTVYIVSRYAPWIDGLDYAVTTAAQQASNHAILDGVSLGDLLPKITVNGVDGSLVAPERCYIDNADVDSGYPVITSITAVPIDDPSAFSTTCYNKEAYGAYVSENAIYFTEFRTDTSLSQYNTRIHKFALSSTSVNYRGSADITGQVWRGGQADFRMSEYAGDLRVLATEFDWSNEDSLDHKLYVLRESSTARELEIVSELPNAARPEEIGKPNEALYGVRFLGDRAYAVTFEQIDPLYVIDMLDPGDPFIAGELTVTGFSDFLHPVNDELLLGLGAGANGGVKLELFDVSNVSQPLSRGSTTLGGAGSYSEARYDRHAFTYQTDVNGIDRFTIPANVYGSDGSLQFVESGLFLFEIRDKDQPALSSLNSVGSIVPPRPGVEIPYVERSRAFIHDDTVFYIRDEAVWVSNWFVPTVINGPF
ncbi:MAG: beta-propeller domain-containing protein [Woeseiaceae bacterium]